MDGSDVVLDRSQTAAIARYFPTTDLAHIGDEISDGLFDLAEDFPLSQFDGLRTDFSLARLRHYTGTPVEDVQSYILFTNYNRYVDEFVRWACEQLHDPNSIYETLSAPAAWSSRATRPIRRRPSWTRPGRSTRCRPIT